MLADPRFKDLNNAAGSSSLNTAQCHATWFKVLVVLALGYI